jgi:hypothetical protein
MSMVKSNWTDLKVGDFFISKSYDGVSEYYLYQKIDQHSHPYNAILLNDGQVCCIAEDTTIPFERVEVTFNIKPIE